MSYQTSNICRKNVTQKIQEDENFQQHAMFQIGQHLMYQVLLTNTILEYGIK